MRFVETPVFTSAVRRHLDDEEYRRLRGLRVIYYGVPAEGAFYMLYVYRKSEQGDLTASQTRELGRLVREEFK